MKRLLILLSVSLVFLTASAASGYKIIEINSSKITYNGKPCHVNDVIYNLILIKWDSESDAMYLQNLNDGHYKIWSAKKHAQHIKDSNGVIVNGPLSSRSVASLNELIHELSDVVLFSDWHCYTTYPTTDRRWFELTFDTPEGEVSQKLDGTPDGEIIISRDIFDGITAPQIVASIKYVFSDGREIPVSSNVNITFAESTIDK